MILRTIKLNIELHKKDRRINTLTLQKESLEEMIKSDLYQKFTEFVFENEQVNVLTEENAKLRKERKNMKINIQELETRIRNLEKGKNKNGKKRSNGKTVHKKSK